VIGIVVVGHSADVARGVVAMVAQAAPDVPAGGAGGLSGGRLGTNAEEVATVLREILHSAAGDPVLVLLDLGSAAMALEIALEQLDDGDRARVAVSEGPVVEGAVAAAVVAAHGGTMAAVRAAADNALETPKLPRA
jgi:dihydroxyacetone kinase DhaKLM complex PTS-EIIA-like component DhaM